MALWKGGIYMRLYTMMSDFKEKENYLPIEFFMQKYGVSKRTIQNDISYLMRIFSTQWFSNTYLKEVQGYLLRSDQ